MIWVREIKCRTDRRVGSMIQKEQLQSISFCSSSDPFILLVGGL